MTTDEPDSQLDPVSAEDEARVRQLLSAAREPGPMPAAVVARLDETLVGLAAERGVDPVPADNVLPLARTRRRRAVVILGAAAAVAVIGGFGFGSFLDSNDSGADSVSDAGADVRVERGGEDSALDATGEPPVENEVEDHRTIIGVDPGAEAYREGHRAYVVGSRHLTRDLARIQGKVLAAPEDADYTPGVVYAPQDFSCRIVRSGRGILVGVLYDGDPAFVRFLEPIGDSQVVDVLQCGTGDPLRSTTLPTHG